MPSSRVRDMFFTYLFWMFLTSMNGVVAGLFISSIVKDSKTAQNIIPLILIPQIILGGALIRYEEMNRNLDLVHRLEQPLRPEGQTRRVRRTERTQGPADV